MSNEKAQVLVDDAVEYAAQSGGLFPHWLVLRQVHFQIAVAGYPIHPQGLEYSPPLTAAVRPGAKFFEKGIDNWPQMCYTVSRKRKRRKENE